MGLNYLYQNPRLTGEECPVCKRKSWNIFKCESCEIAFCQYCKPECVKEEDITEDIIVTCPDCGKQTTFYNFDYF